MSTNADTIRRYIGTPLTPPPGANAAHGFVDPHEALAALDALLAEVEQLRAALGDAATSLRTAAGSLNDAAMFTAEDVAHNAAFVAEDFLAVRG